MQRHLGPQPLDHPLGHRLDLGVGIVLAGDQQRRHFEPDVRFVLEIFEGLEHRRQGSRAELFVEGFGEALEVDIGGVHVAVELRPGLGRDVARRHRHALDAERGARLGDVDGVFVEDHRIVVGEGDGPAIERPGRAGDGGGRRGLGQGVDLARLADVPVLAELAGKIAPGGAEGQHRRARQEVIQGLLLDGVDAEAAGAPVGGKDDAIA